MSVSRARLFVSRASSCLLVSLNNDKLTDNRPRLSAARSPAARFCSPSVFRGVLAHSWLRAPLHRLVCSFRLFFLRHQTPPLTTTVQSQSITANSPGERTDD